MNLRLLPKELQVLISEFNVEHRPAMRVVMNELVINCKKRNDENKHCMNCGDNAEEEKYATYIFWHKYTFCGEWCRYNAEDDIRKSYRMSLRIKKNTL